MKGILVTLFIVVSSLVNAQELPTIAASGFSFPIGTKFTIKLTAVDSVNFNYSVITFERFDKTIDTWNSKDLFEESGKDSTITFYFCVGTNGGGDKEMEQKRQILLLMKNYSKFALRYTSEIQRKEDGEYEPTSNAGTFPGVKSTEMWPYMIYSIGIRDFKKL